MRILETKVYAFNELSDESKENACNRWRESETQFWGADWVIDYFKEVAAIIGINVTNIYYSGFYSQGDGACFEGYYYYKKGSLKAIKSHAPLDTELHEIVSRLCNIQRKSFYELEANIKHRGHYYHELCTDIDVYHTSDYFISSDTEQDIKDALRSLMQWLYSELEKAYAYETSDEAIAETIESNEYEFTQDGILI
jgi:hypothetical protein